MSLVLRLAVGSGGRAAARLALVIFGTAVAAALLMVATGIASVQPEDTAVSASRSVVTYPDGRVEELGSPGSTGPLSNSYLVEPELRRGVVIGFVLCVVPLLVFAAVASRVAARSRDERLAGLRLAGATNAQVRLLAMLDTAVGTATGAVAGAVAYVAGRAALLSVTSGELRDVVEVATPPLWAAAAVLVSLVVASTLASAVVMRRLLITPLGVVRRSPRRHPRPWGLVLLAAGLGGFAVLVTRGVPDTAVGDAAIGAAIATAMLGLVTCGPWLVSLTGRAMRRVPGPAWLLAGRHLEDEPRAAARALSSVVLVVLSATIGLVVLHEFRSADRGGPDPEFDRFVTTGFGLAFAGMAFSLLVGAAGLLLTTLESVWERRRTTTRMLAGGVPASTLRRSAVLQAVVPVVPAAALAVVTGVAAMTALAAGADDSLPIPGTVLLLPVAALGACLLAVLPTLAAIPTAPDPERLRAS